MDKEFFDDQDILTDLLLTQEYLSHIYQFRMQSFTQTKLRGDWADLMAEELEMAYEVLDDLHKRGWVKKDQPIPRVDQKRLQIEGEQELETL